jgi:hypothetical protein
VIVLLFYVGLETRVSDLLQVGPRALLVAVREDPGATHNFQPWSTAMGSGHNRQDSGE